MARWDQAKKFWNTTKEVSVREIAKQTDKPFSIAIIGDEAQRQAVIHRLYPEHAGDEISPERSLIRAFDSTDTTLGFPSDPASDYIFIDAGGARRDAPQGLTLYSVEEMGGIDRVMERILDQRRDLWLSIARRIPGFRPLVSERVIKDAALANAEFAMLNSLPSVIPVIAPLLPAAAIGDIFLLTKNQTMMLFKLAAAHDLPLDVRARSKDLAPLLGNAFGWRAVAREIVGAVPGGVGLVAKGAIAYAGTMAIGRALTKYYETGQQPTRIQIARLYREAYSGAKEIVAERLKAIRGRNGRGVPALPPAPVAEEDMEEPAVIE